MEYLLKVHSSYSLISALTTLLQNLSLHGWNLHIVLNNIETEENIWFLSKCKDIREEMFRKCEEI